MMKADVIQAQAIENLVQKLKEIGYNPLAERASADRVQFKNDRGATREVIIRLLDLDKDRSTSINQRDFDYTPRPDLWILLVLYMRDMEPIPYLIPSTVFDTPNNIFLNNQQLPALRHFSTWEIKVFTKAIPELSRYALDAVTDFDRP